MRAYYVYILPSRTRRLYVGITNDLERRLCEHRSAVGTFASTYFITRLVHFETFADPMAAIAREKQIKGWRRSRKLALIGGANPRWLDLSEGWRVIPDPHRRGGDPSPPLRSGSG